MSVNMRFFVRVNHPEGECTYTRTARLAAVPRPGEDIDFAAFTATVECVTYDVDDPLPTVGLEDLGDVGDLRPEAMQESGFVPA